LTAYLVVALLAEARKRIRDQTLIIAAMERDLDRALRLAQQSGADVTTVKVHILLIILIR